MARGILKLAVFAGLLFSVEVYAETLEYVGSFTSLRSSNTGHVYIYELRLWRNDNSLRGALISIVGLNGDTPTVVESILPNSSLIDSEILVLTPSYSFSGLIENGKITGLLRNGDDVIWGDPPNTENFYFQIGSNITAIPEQDIESIDELDKWLNKLR